MSRKNKDFVTATTAVRPAASCMTAIPAHGSPRRTISAWIDIVDLTDRKARLLSRAW
jgi:hypothetical protein